MTHGYGNSNEAFPSSFVPRQLMTCTGGRASVIAAAHGIWKCAAIAATSILLSVSSTPAIAQLLAAVHVTSDRELPDNPTPQASADQSPAETPSSDSTGSVSGTVLDGTGAAVTGAQVTMLLRNGARLQTQTTGMNGDFTFTTIAPGNYLVQVDASGFSQFTSSEMAITTQQVYVVPPIALSVAGISSEVLVLPTEVIAARQIKAEEKQRVLGLVANFYVSYIPDAAPLTAKQKFSLATHDTLDWSSFVGVTLAAGIEQASDTFPGYGQGASGYGKRWGAQFADGRTSDYLSHAVFASLFHQDPRYFYQGTGTKKSRLYHALGSAFVARSDSGHRMPNYSYLVGQMVSGAISNAYYPASDRGVGLVFTTAAIGIAGRAGQAVAQEFLGKRLTKNAPDGTQLSPPSEATKPYKPWSGKVDP